MKREKGLRKTENTRYEAMHTCRSGEHCLLIAITPSFKGF